MLIDLYLYMPKMRETQLYKSYKDAGKVVLWSELVCELGFTSCRLSNNNPPWEMDDLDATRFILTYSD